MDILTYRQSPSEQERSKSLASLISAQGDTCLDIGARDGFFAMQMTDRFSTVTALDLEKPKILHPNIECVKGDVTDLQFADNSFDFVLCVEVLEHIKESLLENACNEIARVTRNAVVIGVPYRQDIRLARTTCVTCGGINPPWGHVNSFDEKRLISLFKDLHVERIEYVGTCKDVTNWLSTKLYDYSGNPFGTYAQEESCIHCGYSLLPPTSRSIFQRIASIIANTLNHLQQSIMRPRPIWIHILFTKVSELEKI